MGEYADMAIDDALNGYWDGDYDEDGEHPLGYSGYGRRRYSRRKIPTCQHCHKTHLFWEKDEFDKWYLADWNEEEEDYERHVCKMSKWI